MKFVVPTKIKADSELRKMVLEWGQTNPIVKNSTTMYCESDYADAYTLQHSCRYVVGEYAGDGIMEKVLRMESQYEWKWKTDDYSKIVRTMVEPFTSVYYDVLTRIQVILFPPGVARTIHRDRYIGQVYDSGLIISYEDNPDINEWKNLRMNGTLAERETLHRDQNFLGARLELADDSLIVFAADPKEKFTKNKGYMPKEGNVVHNPRDDFFFTYEDCWHSGHPENSWRGLVFIDGILNVDAMEDIYQEFFQGTEGCYGD